MDGRKYVSDIEELEIHQLELDVNEWSPTPKVVLSNSKGELDFMLLSADKPKSVYQTIMNGYTQYCNERDIPTEKRITFGRMYPKMDGINDNGYIYFKKTLLKPATFNKTTYKAKLVPYKEYLDWSIPDRAFLIWKLPLDFYFQMVINSKTPEQADDIREQMFDMIISSQTYYMNKSNIRVWWEEDESDEFWADQIFPDVLSVQKMNLHVILNRLRVTSYAKLSNVRIDLRVVGQENQPGIIYTSGSHTSSFDNQTVQAGIT